MKRQRAKAVETLEKAMSVGNYSRRDAVNHILKGTHHVHSTILGEKDPLVLHTRKVLETEKSQPYSWEKSAQGEMILTDSDQRQTNLEQLLLKLKVPQERELAEKISTIFEELVSNAFFHAYESGKGAPKYSRKKRAQLSPKEAITLSFGTQNGGIFLSVTDRGGNFGFERFQEAFERCYGKNGVQIAAKESGAGLGLFMIYEIATHMRIDVIPGEQTCVSVWISDPRNDDAGRFSFNFFDWRKK